MHRPASMVTSSWTVFFHLTPYPCPPSILSWKTSPTAVVYFLVMSWGVKVSDVKVSVVSDCLWPHGLYSPQNSPGQNTGAGSCSLLQGIFPTQELKPGLLYCRRILYQRSHKGSPGILEWIAIPISRGSSQPGIRPRSPLLQAVSLPREAHREACGPYFPNQGSNPSSLHWKAES